MPCVTSAHFLGFKYHQAIRPTPRVLAPGGGQEVPGGYGQGLPGPFPVSRDLTCSLSRCLPLSVSERAENCCLPENPEQASSRPGQTHREQGREQDRVLEQGKGWGNLSSTMGAEEARLGGLRGTGCFQPPLSPTHLAIRSPTELG